MNYWYVLSHIFDLSKYDYPVEASAEQDQRSTHDRPMAVKLNVIGNVKDVAHPKILLVL